MAINFIPNDPSAKELSTPRAQAKRKNRPAGRAGFTFADPPAEGRFEPGTTEFLFWQTREAALAAVEAWEQVAGTLKAWQGNRKRLPLLRDEGSTLNAFYDRSTFSFFHRQFEDTTFFSGASTDVVAHEVGHGLLDSLRPDLWDAAFLEAGAFHEAFGDCIAILTALHDRETRVDLLAATKTLKKANFVESTSEDLAFAIRRVQANHNAAEPRHAFNDFRFQIPETLSLDGGPGALINEVHSFGMLFSGCFYDLIAGLFAAQPNKTEASLLKAAQTAGTLLIRGAAAAVVTPRFFQSVGRAMVLADDQINGSANRERIRQAFEGHNIMLGANALLAPSALLAGRAPTVHGGASLGKAARRDLAARLGVSPQAKVHVASVDVGGQRFASVVHSKRVALDDVDPRLRGVVMETAVPVIVGASGGRAAVMGAMPEPTSTEREVQAFVRSLIGHGQVEMPGGTPSPAAAARGPAAATRSRRGRATPEVVRETHRVVGKRLVRVRFACGCGG